MDVAPGGIRQKWRGRSPFLSCLALFWPPILDLKSL